MRSAKVAAVANMHPRSPSVEEAARPTPMTHNVEQAILAMKKGTRLLKYGRHGKPQVRLFWLSADELDLRYLSGDTERAIHLVSVVGLMWGQHTPVFQRHLQPEKTNQSFSLIYNNGSRSLDVVCKDQAEADLWFAGLRAVITRTRRSLVRGGGGGGHDHGASDGGALESPGASPAVHSSPGSSPFPRYADSPLQNSVGGSPLPRGRGALHESTSDPAIIARMGGGASPSTVKMYERQRSFDGLARGAVHFGWQPLDLLSPQLENESSDVESVSGSASGSYSSLGGGSSQGGLAKVVSTGVGPEAGPQAAATDASGLQRASSSPGGEMGSRTELWAKAQKRLTDGSPDALPSGGGHWGGQASALGTKALSASSSLEGGQPQWAEAPGGLAIGILFMWGEGLGERVLGGGNLPSGAVGMGSKADALVPRAIEAGVALDVRGVACGGRHVALVTRSGMVFSWGEERGGRLGLGVAQDVGRPRVVDTLGGAPVDMVACGEHHSCAVSAAGELYTWGDATRGAGLLGHGNDFAYWLPKRVASLLDGVAVTQVACGTWHTAVVTAQGQLFTFGEGAFGTLGHGGTSSELWPREVERLRGRRVVHVACGAWHMAAVVDVSGGPGAAPAPKLFTWGDGEKGRLGHGSSTSYYWPTMVEALVEHNMVQVACGHTLTAALSTGGQLFTMGSNAFGQLGDPSAPSGTGDVCQVAGPLDGVFVEQVACGACHVAVLTETSQLFTWGKGASGRLGHGDTKDRDVPTLVHALRGKQLVQVACGGSFTAVICQQRHVPGGDHKVCSQCSQPFTYTKHRHMCYNCGRPFCHACSAHRAVGAAMAPTPAKAFRVCDGCYKQLEKVFAAFGPLAPRAPGGGSGKPVKKSLLTRVRSRGEVARPAGKALQLLDSQELVAVSSSARFRSRRPDPIMASGRGAGPRLWGAVRASPTFAHGLTMKLLAPITPTETIVAQGLALAPKMAPRATGGLAGRAAAHPRGAAGSRSPPRRGSHSPPKRQLSPPKRSSSPVMRRSSTVTGKGGTRERPNIALLRGSADVGPQQDARHLQQQLEDALDKCKGLHDALQASQARSERAAKEGAALVREEQAKLAVANDVIAALSLQVKALAEQSPAPSPRHGQIVAKASGLVFYTGPLVPGLKAAPAVDVRLLPGGGAVAASLKGQGQPAADASPGSAASERQLAPLQEVHLEDPAAYDRHGMRAEGDTDSPSPSPSPQGPPPPQAATSPVGERAAGKGARASKSRYSIRPRAESPLRGSWEGSKFSLSSFWNSGARKRAVAREPAVADQPLEPEAGSADPGVGGRTISLSDGMAALEAEAVQKRMAGIESEPEESAASRQRGYRAAAARRARAGGWAAGKDIILRGGTPSVPEESLPESPGELFPGAASRVLSPWERSLEESVLLQQEKASPRERPPLPPISAANPYLAPDLQGPNESAATAPAGAAESGPRPAGTAPARGARPTLVTARAMTALQVAGTLFTSGGGGAGALPSPNRMRPLRASGPSNWPGLVSPGGAEAAPGGRSLWSSGGLVPQAPPRARAFGAPPLPSTRELYRGRPSYSLDASSAAAPGEGVRESAGRGGGRVEGLDGRCAGPADLASAPVGGRAAAAPPRAEPGGEWMEYPESGVYITLTAGAGGAAELRRVRFSHKIFSEQEAAQWWAANCARIYEQYSIKSAVQPPAGGTASASLPATEKPLAPGLNRVDPE